MKIHTLFVIICLLGLAKAQTLPSFFTQEDLTVLEQLIQIAELHDLASLTETQNIQALEQTFSLGGRLTNALSISGSAHLEGDIYGQAVPNYSVSISLDVMKLLNVDGNKEISEQKRLNAQLENRLSVVEAFVGYKVALLAAETAARALEASEANYRVNVARVKVGENILSQQISAQSDVARAGLELYRANGQVIIGLEALAGVIGVSVSDLVLLLEARDD